MPTIRGVKTQVETLCVITWWAITLIGMALIVALILGYRGVGAAAQVAWGLALVEFALVVAMIVGLVLHLMRGRYGSPSGAHAKSRRAE